jgi:hypothetical protein
MANATYLELTNNLIRQFQEVELSVADWTSAKGLQGFAKQAVNNSLRTIYNRHHYWPFNHASGTQVLTAGTQTYAWPADFKIADWKSFQLQKDAALSVNSQYLIPIDREDWFDNYRDLDTDTPSRDKPRMVFDAHGNNWGVTPSPDKAYTIKYDYYKVFVPLSAYDDVTDIPRDFDHVIQYGAAVQLNLLLDNNEQAQLINQEHFAPALIEMRTILINNDLKLRDTRVSF